VPDCPVSTSAIGALLPWAKTHGAIVLQPKQVSIWAGINGHGKSALLNQVIAEFCKQQSDHVARIA
jgi:twinkle protein